MTSETKKIIQHWRDAVPNDRLAHLVRDVSRAFTRSLTIRLEKHGVPFGHWSFLRVLWEADGLTQKELSERAGVMEPTTFIAMKSMEAQGYIVRKQLPPNKKNVYVYLSPKGRALKNKLVPLAVESNNVGVEGIPAADVKFARQVLLSIIENLARDEQLEGDPAARKISAALKPEGSANSANSVNAAAAKISRRPRQAVETVVPVEVAPKLRISKSARLTKTVRSAKAPLAPLAITPKKRKST